MRLRPYQREACDETWHSLETRHTCLVSPTGTGKSLMALAVSEKAVRAMAGPVLLAAPTDEIYGQMIATYQRAGWMVHADKAERHARPALAMEQALDGNRVVIIASVGTLRIRDRIERYPRDGWALTIMDEVHHSPAATWLGIREYFDQPWMGMTATPERDGMRNLWHDVHAFPEGLLQAINEGWLVPYNEKYVDGMDQATYEALKSDDAREVDPAIEKAVATIVRDIGDHQGISFWPRTRVAGQVAKALRSLPGGITAHALTGAMPRDERNHALRQYAAATLRMLALCQVGVEGLDVPMAALLAIFQQTKIRSRVAQMVGRVLRPAPGCLEGLDDAPATERRAAIAASAKPVAWVRSIAPPDLTEGWETPGTLLWGHLPKPVLIDIDRRMREGRDLEAARADALTAEAEREAKRRASKEAAEKAESLLAPHRARRIAEAQPYELRDPAEFARQAVRDRLKGMWRRWRALAQSRAAAEGRNPATERQAGAVVDLLAEKMRDRSIASPAGRAYTEVLTWDTKTANKALHALRMMCGRPRHRGTMRSEGDTSA